MEKALQKLTWPKPSLGAVIRMNSLGAVFIAVVLAPLGAHYAPLIRDRYGKTATFTSGADGVALTYPARWESYTQEFEGGVPGGPPSTRVVVAPPGQRDSVGGVEVRTYASERVYLAEMNAGSALSLPDFLSASKGAGTVTVASSRHEAYFMEGNTYPSVCFVVSSPEHLHTLCADGASSPGGMTPAQRLVLERAVLR